MTFTNATLQTSGSKGRDGSEKPSADADNAETLNPFGQYSLDSVPDFIADVEITNRLGLHGRAAAQLSKAIEDFDCEIFVEKGPFRADAKSILDLLSLCCSKGTRIKIGAIGPAAEDAVTTAVKVVKGGFEEEE
ncbi:MAG: HPr family phosphocarrier protein [Deltaproteobacteria bacterium]|jgi:phosphocarrier protein|nr:HPr family phosphocarrier protein [Deltaproteobacteria bacterium]